MTELDVIDSYPLLIARSEDISDTEFNPRCLDDDDPNVDILDILAREIRDNELFLDLTGNLDAPL